MYGFQDVWLNQGVYNVNVFLCQFRERVEARFISEMVAFDDESTKCVLYRLFINPYGIQFYLDRPVKYIHKTFISKYRLSSHSLSIETGILYNIERNMGTCNVCHVNLI